MFQNWYDVAEHVNISQGDILFNIPIFIPQYPSNILKTGAQIECPEFDADVIILTQACDLEIREGKDSPKIDTVLVAALTNARTYDKAGRDTLLEISNLKRTNLFLLEPSENGICMDYHIVHFDQLYSVPWDYLNNLNKDRKHLRLKSPFMELLSHHFGNYFSRVAIPGDRAPQIDKYFDIQKQYIKEKSKNQWFTEPQKNIMQYLSDN